MRLSALCTSLPLEGRLGGGVGWERVSKLKVVLFSSGVIPSGAPLTRAV